MRDFEVLTLKGPVYVMQVNKKWYVVPHKWRRLNTVKLAGAFDRGERFAEYKEPLAVKRPE